MGVMQSMLGGNPNSAVKQNKAIQAQQAEQEKQNQYRQAQQWDMDTLQHLTSQGALFGDPHTGLVKETTSEPDTSGLNNGYPITTTIMRAMDPDRTIKFKDADGNQIQAELPTPDQQRARQLQTLYMQRKAEGEGTAAGTPQVDISEDDPYKTANNLPAGMTQIPQSGAVGLAERTVPATIRGTTATNVAGINVAGRQGVADTRAQTAKDQQDLQAAQFQQSEDDKNKWEASRLANARFLAGLTTGRAKMTQDATDARNFQDNFARNVQLHTTLGRNILAEQQKQLGADNILGNDASGQPNTPDGTSFNDPFNGGKPTAMNGAQRLILGQRSAASKAAAVDMLKTKGQLESQRDNILARLPGAAAPAASNTPAGGPPASNIPAGTPAPAKGGKGAAPVRVKVQLQDGRKGTVDAKDFDAKTMTKL